MSAALKNKTVLIIEDMQSMRAIEKAFLYDMGIGTVQEAVNGNDALKKPDTHNFDLIVCDWDMPEMTGLELLKRVRNKAETKQLPFLMVTGVTQTEKVRQAITEGVNDYMVKPFQQAMMEEKVRKLLAS